MTHTEQHSRMMVDWAAPVLKMHGCKLHAHADGWDVEMRDGSWCAANNPQELSQLAVRVQAAASLGKDPRGPIVRIIAVEESPSGGATIIATSCGHRSEVNQIYSYRVGSESRCFKCRKELDA